MVWVPSVSRLQDLASLVGLALASAAICLASRWRSFPELIGTARYSIDALVGHWRVFAELISVSVPDAPILLPRGRAHGGDLVAPAQLGAPVAALGGEVLALGAIVPVAVLARCVLTLGTCVLSSGFGGALASLRRTGRVLGSALLVLLFRRTEVHELAMRRFARVALWPAFVGVVGWSGCRSEPARGEGETPRFRVERALPAASPAAGALVTEVARHWQVAKRDLRPGAVPAFVRVGDVRRPAVVAPVGATITTRIGWPAREIRYWIAPPVGKGELPPDCRIEVRSTWSAAGRTSTYESSTRDTGSWIPFRHVAAKVVPEPSARARPAPPRQQTRANLGTRSCGPA